MIILGIESTCDDTSCGIVKDGTEILGHVIASQADFHEQFGGVFPEHASRLHQDNMLPVVDQAMKQAGVTPDDIDLIAVSNCPGLMGSILVGLSCAKALSYAWNKPLIGVNHLEAHLYSAMMHPDHRPTFPALGAVLSGGHTYLSIMHSITEHELVSTTVDDAIGEAFDKVAQLLDLPYPGGPEIEKLAQSGNENAYPFKAGNVKGRPLHFSFSGLKTNVMYSVCGQNKQQAPRLSQSKKADIAASFQKAALGDVVDKIKKAKNQFEIECIYLGGGVTGNQYLKKCLEGESCFYPPKGLSIDNGAMIAGYGYHLYQMRGADPLDLQAMPRVIKKDFSLIG